MDNNKIDEAELTKNIKTLVLKKRYEDALRELEDIDLRKVRQPSILCLAGEVYMGLKKYDQAEKVLLRAYERQPGTRRTLDLLTTLYIDKGEYAEAEYYYKEFIGIASKDLHRYILRYRLDKAKGERLSVLIDTLEKLKDYEYIEEWAYELASLYDKSGETQKCIRECDEIVLWFGHGEYVNKAIALKARLLGLPVPEFTEEEPADSSEASEQEAAVEKAADQAENDDTELTEAEQAALNAAIAGLNQETFSEEDQPYANAIDLSIVESGMKAERAKHSRETLADILNTAELELQKAREEEAKMLAEAAEKAEAAGGQAAQEAAVAAGEAAETVEELAGSAVEAAAAAEGSLEAAADEAGPLENAFDPAELDEPEDTEITRNAAEPETAEASEEVSKEVISEEEESASGEKNAIISLFGSLFGKKKKKAEEAEPPASDNTSGDGAAAAAAVIGAAAVGGAAVAAGTAEAEAETAEIAAGAASETADALTEEALSEAAEEIAAAAEKSADEAEEAAEEAVQAIEETGRQTEEAGTAAEEAAGKAAAAAEEVSKEFDDEFADETAEKAETAEAQKQQDPDQDYYDEDDETEDEPSDEISALFDEAERTLQSEAAEEQEKAAEMVAAAAAVGAVVEGDVVNETGEAVEAVGEATEEAVGEAGEAVEAAAEDVKAETAEAVETAEAEVKEAVETAEAEVKEAAETMEAEAAEELEKTAEAVEAEAASEGGSAAESVAEAEVEDEIFAEGETLEEAAAKETVEEDDDDDDEDEVLDDDFEDEIIDELFSDNSEHADSALISELFAMAAAGTAAAAAEVKAEAPDTGDISEVTEEAAADRSLEAADDLEDEDEDDDEDDDEIAENGAASDTVMNIFGSVSSVKSIQSQLVKTFTKFESPELDTMDLLAPYDINFIVTGTDMSVKSQIAIGIAKALNTYGVCDKNKLVRACAAALNQRNFEGIFDKLAGGCLVIEDADELNERSVSILSEYVNKEDQKVAIVMELDEDHMTEIFTRYPELRSKFLNIIHIGKYNENELVQLAKGYAKNKGYEISMSGASKLKRLLKERMRDGASVNYEDIMEITEEAISSLEKRNMRNLFMTVLENKYEDAAMFVLQSEDFDNINIPD
ncbi:MAG: tetratricopeptide repeat protein [Lachnospiraceae bacterium]|nr:tetratricopeptide repeat protein [Lachnospiraceae bacterium]